MLHKTIIFNLESIVCKAFNEQIMELLKELKLKGFKLCVYTDKNRECSDKILNAEEFKDLFLIKKSNDGGYTKAQLIRQILDESASCSAIIITNSQSDEAVAYDVGCISIHTRYNNIGNDSIEVEYWVDTPLAILSTVEGINAAFNNNSGGYIDNKHINLLPVEKSHLALINKMLAEDNARKMLGVVSYPSEDYYMDPNNRCYAILDLEGNFVGIVELMNISWKNRRGELSIAIEASHRGKGFGYQAINEILNIGFYELGLNRIWLRVLDNNIRAIELYEKIGFVLEGVCREESLREGRFYNQLQMSMLKKEWLSKG